MGKIHITVNRYKSNKCVRDIINKGRLKLVQNISKVMITNGHK
jgi:hypothetical protein